MIQMYSGKKLQPYLDYAARNQETQTATTARLVRDILDAVRRDGDVALVALARQFNDPDPDMLVLSTEETERRKASVSAKTRALLQRAADAIRRFAEAQMERFSEITVDMGGYTAGMRFMPVESAGCYVPSGRFPLPSTALMTTITAQVAGVKNIIIACPDPGPEIVYAGSLAGVQTYYCVGGAQAVAALAYGTHAIEKADMVVGPGNEYVTEAKRQLSGIIGIDMLAGPSEVAIFADKTADAAMVAADMLAQVEHDPQARAWLVTDNEELAVSVGLALSEQVSEGNYPDFLNLSLAGSAILVTESRDKALAIIDRLAAEHVHLACSKPEAAMATIRHGGAFFLGRETTVPMGDYVAGPNHTLPTGGSARFAGGLGPMTFLRPQSWVTAGTAASRLGADAAAFAEIEGLKAHARAAALRTG